jgi:hypothetical protein
MAQRCPSEKNRDTMAGTKREGDRSLAGRRIAEGLKQAQEPAGDMMVVLGPNKDGSG